MLLNALKLPSFLIANEIQFAGRELPHQNVVRARVPVARTLITIFFETARPELAYSVPSYEPPFFGVAPARAWERRASRGCDPRCEECWDAVHLIPFIV